MAPRRIDLMIAGSHKAGTSSLKQYVAQHPAICMHAQGEIAFFVYDHEYAEGWPAAWERYYAACAEGQLVAAKNVAIMYTPRARERFHAHNPEAHVVVMLRNPIDRAYSAYWYARRRGFESLGDFSAAIAAEPERLRTLGDEARHVAYLDRGIYAPQIVALRRLFGEQRVLVFLSDDLKKSAAEVCRRTFEFAGVDATFVPDTGRRHNEAAMARSRLLAKTLSTPSTLRQTIRKLLPRGVGDRIRQRLVKMNEREFTPPPLPGDVRARLVEHFRAHNDELAALLGRDLSHWNRAG